MPRPLSLGSCAFAAAGSLAAGLALERLEVEGRGSCGPPKGVVLASPRSDATGPVVCDELLRLPNYDQLPDLPAKPCNVNTGENCRAVLQLGGASGDAAAGFSSTFGTYTINQLVLAEVLGMIPYANYSEEHAGSYWEKGQQGGGGNAWEYYFGPVSAYSPGDARFAELPVCKVGRQLNLQLHYRQGWSVRPWGYGCARRRTYEETIARSRPLGARIVAQYYRVKPEVDPYVEGALGEGRHWGAQKVLGMHIRGTDKANGRQVVDPDAYLPHAAEFVRRYPGSLIYLATDDEGFRSKVLAWPSQVSSRVVAHPLFTLARTSEHPFGGKRYRREEGLHVLVDILSLSKCDWLLHSISGLSEMAVYFNPALQKHSTNLERGEKPIYDLH